MDNAAADALVGFVINRAHLQLHGLEIAERPFDELEAFV